MGLEVDKVVENALAEVLLDCRGRTILGVGDDSKLQRQGQRVKPRASGRKIKIPQQMKSERCHSQTHRESPALHDEKEFLRLGRVELEEWGQPVAQIGMNCSRGRAIIACASISLRPDFVVASRPSSSGETEIVICPVIKEMGQKTDHTPYRPDPCSLKTTLPPDENIAPLRQRMKKVLAGVQLRVELAKRYQSCHRLGAKHGGDLAIFCLIFDIEDAVLVEKQPNPGPLAAQEVRNRDGVYLLVHA